jgi:inositol phosphorylceramide mannosyltransferase catalytic subunit
VKNINAPIPPRIIQTGKTRKLKLVEQAAVASLTALNPGFTYIYFDDADVNAFIDREFPEYRRVFNDFSHPIQRIDFFRYLAVYRLGGFYFDLDVFLTRGVQDLRVLSCVFPFEELTLCSYLRTKHCMDWEIGNYAFGASAGHPFLHDIIENCVRAQEDPAWVSPMMAGIPFLLRSSFDVLNTTGPGLVTRTLAEHPESASRVSVLFPEDVCDTSTWHNFGDYGVHMMAGSWRGRGNYITRRLALLWENQIRRRFNDESRKLGKHRVYPLAPATSL